MNEGSLPTTAELLQAIVALHAFTEAGLQRLDSRIDRLDGTIDRLGGKLDRKIDSKVDGLRYDMNKRFDHVYGELDEIKTRITRLELRPT
jgi:hypothetical protein